MSLKVIGSLGSNSPVWTQGSRKLRRLSAVYLKKKLNSLSCHLACPGGSVEVFHSIRIS